MRVLDKVRRLGPGIVTGAADDDPSGIATYSQAGAQFGPALLWTLVLAYPLMVAVQLVSARVGRVTGHGLAGSLGAVLPRWAVAGLIILLFTANTINLGADLAMMGEAAALIAGSGKHAFTIGFATVSLLLQLFVPYHRYASFLKWLTLSLLAYIALPFMVRTDWPAMASGALVPRIPATAAITTVVAVLGTTISPYLFFWQAAQEVEEIHRVDGRRPLDRANGQAPDAFSRIRWDTFGGMAASNIVALSIMIGTAATLHAAGARDIQSAADAARALQPVAGNFAFALFSMGIIGTGLLAVPVLAGSSAYAACEIFGWRSGLEHRPHRARAFYTVIVLGTVLGLAMNWLAINPVKALFWSAVINGVAAVPILAAMMVVVADRKVMHKFAAPPLLKAFGWLATAVMGAAAIAMVVVPK